MKIIVLLLNWLNGKTTSTVTMQDIYGSKYISLYEYRRKKRDYRDFLEQTTLNRVNNYIENEFPKNIKKEHKTEIIDCTVIFLKYIMINYDYFPGDDSFEKEFNKIIAKNINKLKNN